MKVQFIIVGWHYNQPDFYDGLKQLNDNKHDGIEVDVFWSCHNEPPQPIKDNFKYKVFPNEGLEDGAYQQAINYLDLDDDTILFMMHDDLIIKKWNFIPICIQGLEKHKMIGNGINYPTTLTPTEQYLKHVKDECKHLFDRELHMKTIRESFMCMKYSDLKEIGEFEVIWETPDMSSGKPNIGGMGNTQQALLSYKLVRVFGNDNIVYLGNRYLDSEFIYEQARGKMDSNNPMS